MINKLIFIMLTSFVCISYGTTQETSSALVEKLQVEQGEILIKLKGYPWRCLGYTDSENMNDTTLKLGVALAAKIQNTNTIKDLERPGRPSP